jgi:hypothetical protein
MTRAQRREDHAQHHRLQKYREPLQRAHARAPRSLHALEQALVDLGVPETRAPAVQGRLQAGGTLMGQICGLMCPTLCGGRTDHERTRVRGGEKNLPSQIVGALPQQQWLRQVPHRGQERRVTLWRHVEGRRLATRRRWPWMWVRDDRVFKKSGQHLGLVGSWSRGQAHRVRLGIDGLRRLVVSGEGKLVMPVDCTMRRPDPRGPGRPCRDQLTWVQVMLDRTGTALQRLGLVWPAPLVVADRGCGASKWLAHLAPHQHGSMVVEGKRTEVVQLPDGRRVTAQALVTRADWPWRDRLQLLGRRSARLTAISPTYGPVTASIVKEPGEACDDLRCQVTPVQLPG